MYDGIRDALGEGSEVVVFRVGGPSGVGGFIVENIATLRERGCI